MRNYRSLFFALIIGGILGFSLAANEDRISVVAVKHAQRLIGFEFSETAIDTMVNYLNRNLKGYDTMRSYSNNLTNDIAPPLYFDPLPDDFEFESQQIKIDWQLTDNVELSDDTNELAFYSISQLASLIKNQKITSTELTKFFIKRIKKYDHQLFAVISLTEELALKQAALADEEIKSGKYRGSLHGIPYGIKDLFAVEGYKTTWGAAPYKNQILDYNATVVEKLEEAGAVLIAKLTSGALARGDVWFGGKTRNPWDLEQGASGSSAGSGSATSAGLVPFSIGTETLGSITSPATRNGVSGLRPTYGRVSRYGCMPLSWTMDKPGPLCRNVTDCALVFDVIRGIDTKDRTTIEAAFNYNPNRDIQKMKIGYLRDQFESDTTSNGVNNEATLEIFRSLGVELKAVETPKNIPYDVFDIILRAEAGAFFDELVRSQSDSLMVQQDGRSRANSLRQSRFIPAVEYLQANRHRSVLINEFNKIMKELDVLISPTFGGKQLLITNLTGHPALAIPNGFDRENHPTSITLVGNLYDEASILTLGKAFQEATDFEEKHPPGF
ncbi:MAG: amidase [Cyclobacteriaceae bacterium]